MGAWITRRRAPHARSARWLRVALLMGLGLGRLAGCTPLTDVASPELGRSLDDMRQEVAQVRAEMAQLRERLRQVEDRLGARNTPLVQLGKRLSAVERRLATLEGTPPKPNRPPAPASRGSNLPSGHRLQVGMSPDEVRALLGAPVSIEETPKFLFWHYGPEQSVVFRRDTERVQGWLGFAP
jgi:hypothetical protein